MIDLRPFAALAALCAPLVAQADFEIVPHCVDDGHCHLPRWIPDDLLHDARFGFDVTVQGEHAAVGAPGEDRVHVYRRLGAYWESYQVIEDPHAGVALGGSGFGEKVELSGLRLVVAAPEDDLLGTNVGAVHVYDRIGGAFVLQQTLTPTWPDDHAMFGRGLAVHGSWLAAGAPNAPFGGHVSIYKLEDGQWGLHQVRSEPGSGNLGASCAIEALYLFVGDPSNSTMGAHSGAVYRYLLTDNVVPSGVDYSPDPNPGDSFGCSLDVDEERLVVGAYGDDEAASGAGAAYVYAVEGGGPAPFFSLDEIQKLVPCSPQEIGAFGRDVAIHEKRIAVASPDAEVPFMPGGSAMTFIENGLFGEHWSAEDHVLPADGVANDRFGCAVDVQDGEVLVGAYDVAGSGAAYLVSTNRRTMGGGECPCDALADETQLGTGKAGSLGVPELEFTNLLVPGESTSLRLTNALPHALPLLIWGLQAIPTPFDDGTLWVGDPHFLLLPPASEWGMLAMPISATPAICGAQIVFQAMFYDPGAAGEEQTAQSPGLRMRIGY